VFDRDAFAMPGDFWIDDFSAERLETAECPFLVTFDQARIACYIVGQYGGKPRFDASLPCGLHSASCVANDPTPPGSKRHLARGLDQLAIFTSRSERTLGDGYEAVFRRSGRFPVISRLSRFFPVIGGGKFPVITLAVSGWYQ
jgi:hypothetical protein